jgi:hypothetical protein
MSERKDVIRRHDRVRILNPQIFLRCGYPLTKKMIKDTITKEQMDSIHEMFRKFNINTQVPEDVKSCLLFDYTKFDDKAYQAVLNVMAGVLLRKQGWGGRERCIYTEHKPVFFNATGTVYEKRVVKTGVHHSGGCSYDYYSGGYDFDPPFLGNEETHVILEISTDFMGEYPGGHRMEIEKCHVEKVSKTDRDPVYLEELV